MSLRYVVRHVTRFVYSAPVRETLMEVRMQPRSEDRQICLSFELAVEPTAQVQSFRDYQGNVVHHFDIPRPICELSITALSRLQVQEPEPPPSALSTSVWDELDRALEEGEHFDFLSPTARTCASDEALEGLRRELGAFRRDDPLTVLRELNQGLHEHLRYAPHSTAVETALDEVLAARAGVCQDFAHLFLALARQLGIPARYVSGYLYHRDDTSVPDASHAWV
ncbi:transglutaminase family protein, partial [bacterium CPR1]|nr:transglutaminase family protein [bacterium CPR1]